MLRGWQTTRILVALSYTLAVRVFTPSQFGTTLLVIAGRLLYKLPKLLVLTCLGVLAVLVTLVRLYNQDQKIQRNFTYVEIDSVCFVGIKFLVFT